MADPKLIFADVPQAHGNYVVVVPLTSYGETDISVYLMDLSVPITVRLTFGAGDRYYQRADIRVAKRGPKAKPLLKSGRSAWRESVCQHGSIRVLADSLKKKQ